MKNNPVVSIIITTRNEAKNIEVCMKSIMNQTYQPIEIIVVDNNSTDKTVRLAKKYTKKIFNKGPERSTQRNIGVQKAKGRYVLIIDADMKLTKYVVAECVEIMQTNKVGGIIIAEESYGKGFWAHVRKFERSFYSGNDLIEAARFYDRDKFLTIGGYDEKITGPEDWDFSQRMRKKYGLTRINSLIYHNEGNLSFTKSVSKKFYYSKKFAPYIQKRSNQEYASSQTNIFHRYGIFFSQPGKLLKNPILAVGVILLKTTEFMAGGIGYIIGTKK